MLDPDYNRVSEEEVVEATNYIPHPWFAKWLKMIIPIAKEITILVATNLAS